MREKDYYLHERSFGSFEHSFALPEGVDRDKVEASFNKRCSYGDAAEDTGSAESGQEITVKAASIGDSPLLVCR